MNPPPTSHHAKPTSDVKAPLVGVVMGSASDWPTMKLAVDVLDQFGISSEALVVSAHRTPQWMAEYADSAASRGLRIIIAGAGGAAHLPGMIASQTPLPVIGVPVKSRALQGVDSLLSIVQMPGGVPVATMAIGDAGAKNAGLFAVRMLASSGEGVDHADLQQRLETFTRDQAEAALAPELTR